jgi:hypothetical protein
VPGSSVSCVAAGEWLDSADVVVPGSVAGALLTVAGDGVLVTVTTTAGLLAEQAASNPRRATPTPHRRGLSIMHQR